MSAEERRRVEEGQRDDVEGTATERTAPGGPMTSSPPGTELMPAPPPIPATVAVKPRVGADDLVERLEVIQRAQSQAMEDGVDYGVIPGTDKPTLLKPGAEKLSVLFELDVQIVNDKLWAPPHLTVISKAVVYHAPSGARLGYGEGICTTQEKKYAKRRAQRKCPECNQETIFKSKYSKRGEPDDAPPCWFCWGSKGGCGTEFDHDDKRITNQEAGEIENPNLPDTWNTVVKIAEKRARVDAVLAVTGASALFTQDVEDLPPEDRADGGSSSEEMKTTAKRGRKGGGSSGRAEPPTKSMKGAVTKLLNAKIPDEDLRKRIRENVRETKGEYGKLIGNLKKVTPDNLSAFLNAVGIHDWTPPSDVPGDTSDLDAADREEAKAKAAAEAEGGGDAVEQTLLGDRSDDES